MSRAGPLSDREMEVLRLLARGLTREQIAARLHISVSTVKSHVALITARMRAENAPHAVALGYEWGLLRIGEMET